MTHPLDRITTKDVSATRQFPSGAWEVSAVVGTRFIRRTYYGYPKREAVRAFVEEVNTAKNPSPAAERFIGRTIRRLAKRGEKGKQAVAIAYRKARRAGYRIPAKRNPAKVTSERQAWTVVRDMGRAITKARLGYPLSAETQNVKEVAKALARLAEHMLLQLGRGVHENPALAVLGNPPDGVAGTIAKRVYQIRYQHAQDGKNYKHDFGPGVRATLLKDGRAVLWHPSKPVWEDLPQ